MEFCDKTALKILEFCDTMFCGMPIAMNKTNTVNNSLTCFIINNVLWVNTYLI